MRMKLFIITQAVDSTHSALGFFVEWIKAFREHPAISSVTVASFDSSKEIIDHVDLRRIEVVEKWQRIRYVWDLLKASDWDVLFVHMTPMWCIACWPIVVLKRKKMVLWYTHGSSSFALRIACLLCNEVYTATQEAFPIRSSKCFAVGHGIPDMFRSVDREEVDGHRYLAVGRLSRRKRVIETLEFFHRIRVIDPQAILTWAGESMGDTVYESDIQSTIRRLGLEPSVRMSGAILYSETPQLYARHDLLLHLSATGSLDKVVIEALASGCAVFSTNSAIEEGLGSAWYWRGKLDNMAVARAIETAIYGVSQGVREKVANQYGLALCVDRVCKMMTRLVSDSMR
jgi:glycosyltransferase involved in cell wall biosynthesis